MRIGSSNEGSIDKIKSRIAQANCKQEEKDTTAWRLEDLEGQTLLVAKNEDGTEVVYKIDSKNITW